jgi:hypothetical protein
MAHAWIEYCGHRVCILGPDGTDCSRSVQLRYLIRFCGFTKPITTLQWDLRLIVG